MTVNRSDNLGLIPHYCYGGNGSRWPCCCSTSRDHSEADRDR